MGSLLLLPRTHHQPLSLQVHQELQPLVESLLGISEKAQGCPIGTIDKPVPIRDGSALSPLRCQAPGCPCCTVLCGVGGGPRLFLSRSHPVAGLPRLDSLYYSVSQSYRNKVLSTSYRTPGLLKTHLRVPAPCED